MRLLSLVALIAATAAQGFATDAARAACVFTGAPPGRHVLVTSRQDSGPSTLRAALDDLQPDDTLDLRDLCGKTIALVTPLPDVDATNVSILGCGVHHPVRIDGALLVAGDGLRLAADDVTVCGVRALQLPDSGFVVTAGSGATLYENIASDNDAYGIRLASGTSGVTLSRNFVSGNTSGPITLEGTANADVSPPPITDTSSPLIAGTVAGPVSPDGSDQPRQASAGTIEIFWGASPSDATVFVGTYAAPSPYSASPAQLEAATVWTFDTSTRQPPLPPGYFVATFTSSDSGATSAFSEVCDGSDNDEDGLVDEDFDFDGDGATTCAAIPDCNDMDERFNWTDLDQDGLSTCSVPFDCYDDPELYASARFMSDDGDGDLTSHPALPTT